MVKVAVYFQLEIVAIVTTDKPFMQEEKKHEKVLYSFGLNARGCDAAARVRPSRWRRT
jgi:hypothetical protein